MSTTKRVNVSELKAASPLIQKATKLEAQYRRERTGTVSLKKEINELTKTSFVVIASAAEDANSTAEDGATAAPLGEYSFPELLAAAPMRAGEHLFRDLLEAMLHVAPQSTHIQDCLREYNTASASTLAPAAGAASAAALESELALTVTGLERFVEKFFATAPACTGATHGSGVGSAAAAAAADSKTAVLKLPLACTCPLTLTESGVDVESTKPEALVLTVGDRVNVTRSKTVPKQWTTGIVKKVEGVQVYVQYEKNTENPSAEPPAYFFRVDSGNIRPLTGGGATSAPTVKGKSDCILLFYRAFLEVQGPDYWLRLVPPSTLPSATKLEPLRDQLCEWLVKLAFQLQWLQGQNALSKCDGNLVKAKIVTSATPRYGGQLEQRQRWWCVDVLGRMLACLSSHAVLTESVIHSCFELMVGRVTLPVGRRAKPKSDFGPLNTIVWIWMLKPTLWAMARAPRHVIKASLENLRALVLLNADNSRLISAEREWLRWFAPILACVDDDDPNTNTTAVDGPSASDAEGVSPGSDEKEAEGGSATPPAVSPVVAARPLPSAAPRPSLILAAGGTVSTTPTGAPLPVKKVELMTLVIALIVSLFHWQFLKIKPHVIQTNDSAPAQTGGGTPNSASSGGANTNTTAAPATQSPPGGSANAVAMANASRTLELVSGAAYSNYLWDRFDELEDVGGWNTHTVALFRVILYSVLKQIVGASAKDGTGTGGGSGKESQWRNNIHHSCWAAFFGLMDVLEDFVYFSGFDEERTMRRPRHNRFQNLCVHLTVEGCLDIPMVKKMAHAYEVLSIKHLRPEAYNTPQEQDKLRAMQKRMEEDVAFLTDTVSYLSLLPAHVESQTGAHLAKMDGISIQLAQKLAPRRKRFLAGAAFTVSIKEFSCSTKHVRMQQGYLKTWLYQRETLTTNKWVATRTFNPAALADARRDFTSEDSARAYFLAKQQKAQADARHRLSTGEGTIATDSAAPAIPKRKQRAAPAVPTAAKADADIAAPPVPARITKPGHRSSASSAASLSAGTIAGVRPAVPAKHPPAVTRPSLSPAALAAALQRAGTLPSATAESKRPAGAPPIRPARPTPGAVVPGAATAPPPAEPEEESSGAVEAEEEILDLPPPPPPPTATPTAAATGTPAADEQPAESTPAPAATTPTGPRPPPPRPSAISPLLAASVSSPPPPVGPRPTIKLGGGVTAATPPAGAKPPASAAPSASPPTANTARLAQKAPPGLSTAGMQPNALPSPASGSGSGSGSQQLSGAEPLSAGGERAPNPAPTKSAADPLSPNPASATPTAPKPRPPALPPPSKPQHPALPPTPPTAKKLPPALPALPTPPAPAAATPAVKFTAPPTDDDSPLQADPSTRASSRSQSDPHKTAHTAAQLKPSIATAVGMTTPSTPTAAATDAMTAAGSKTASSSPAATPPASNPGVKRPPPPHPPSASRTGSGSGGGSGSGSGGASPAEATTPSAAAAAANAAAGYEDEEEDDGDSEAAAAAAAAASYVLRCTACKCLWSASANFCEWNGLPYCEKDYLGLVTTCAHCKKIFSPNESYVTVAGDEEDTSDIPDLLPPAKLLFHSACLKCVDCNKLLSVGGADDDSAPDAGSAAGEATSDTGVFPHGGKLYCRTDYLQRFGPRCAQCEQIIDGEYVTALGHHWHSHHFLCGGLCHRELSLASSYHTLAAAQKTALYSTILPAWQQAATPAGSDKKVAAAMAEPDGQVALCPECYTQLFKCVVCTKLIRGDELQWSNGGASGTPNAAAAGGYHKECFVCCEPNCVNNKQPATAATGAAANKFMPGPNNAAGDHRRVFCQSHYLAKFAFCSGCSQSLSGATGSVLKAAGGQYHRKCFCCATCSKSLTGGVPVFAVKRKPATPDGAPLPPLLYCKDHYTKPVASTASSPPTTSATSTTQSAATSGPVATAAPPVRPPPPTGSRPVPPPKPVRS